MKRRLFHRPCCPHDRVGITGLSGLHSASNSNQLVGPRRRRLWRCMSPLLALTPNCCTAQNSAALDGIADMPPARRDSGPPACDPLRTLARPEFCSPHEPRDAPKATPPAICGDGAAVPHIAARPQRMLERRLLERRAAHAGYASFAIATKRSNKPPSCPLLALTLRMHPCRACALSRTAPDLLPGGALPAGPVRGRLRG
jgi:hypothetical protein